MVPTLQETIVICEFNINRAIGQHTVRWTILYFCPRLYIFLVNTGFVKTVYFIALSIPFVSNENSRNTMPTRVELFKLTYKRQKNT